MSFHLKGFLLSSNTEKIILFIHMGANLVEYNLIRDHHDMTAMLAFKLMKELVGKMLNKKSSTIAEPLAFYLRERSVKHQ